MYCICSVTKLRVFPILVNEVLIPLEPNESGLCITYNLVLYVAWFDFYINMYINMREGTLYNVIKNTDWYFNPSTMTVTGLILQVNFTEWAH